MNEYKNNKQQHARIQHANELGLLVDAQDYDLIYNHKWCKSFGKKGDPWMGRTRSKVNGKMTKLHLEVVKRVDADRDGLECHHINGQTVDNRRSNLVMVTKEEHQRIHALERTEGHDAFVAAGRAARERWLA